MLEAMNLEWSKQRGSEGGEEDCQAINVFWAQRSSRRSKAKTDGAKRTRPWMTLEAAARDGIFHDDESTKNYSDQR
jgi:hypothetical protein